MQEKTDALSRAEGQLKDAEAEYDRAAGEPKPIKLSDVVLKKLKETFASELHGEARRMLETGVTLRLPFVTTDESLDRVRLAAIKIANGDLAELRRQVDAAKLDWRDVINAAEYPESSALGLVGFSKLDKKAQQELQTRDREQYVAWLGEPKSRSGGILGKLFSRKKN